MAVWYIKLGVVLITLCVMGISAGCNLALPGYSRRKILAGISATTQMAARYRAGTWLKFYSISAGVIIIIIHVVLGLMISNGKPEYSLPKDIEIWHSVDQDKAILLIDGKLYSYSHEQVPYYIDKDYPGIFYTRDTNLYGYHIGSDKDLHILIEPELDDNIVVGDSFKEWED